MAETIRTFTTKQECSDGDWITVGRPVHFDKIWMNVVCGRVR